MTESESHKFETIRSWMNGKRNYQQGVILLKAYHSDTAQANSLDRFQNEYLLNHMMDELYEELKAKKSQVASSKEIQVEQPVAASIKNPISEIPTTPRSSDLKKLEDIKKARTQLYKERASFHAEMCSVAYQESGTLKPVLIKHEIERRHELTKLIMSHTDQIDKYWAITDYYEVHGTFPHEMKEAVVAPIPITNAEALRKLLNTRTNISKTEKKISDAKVMLPHLTGRELEKAKKKIADWDVKLQILEAEKLECEKQINEPKDN